MKDLALLGISSSSATASYPYISGLLGGSRMALDLFPISGIFVYGYLLKKLQISLGFFSQ
jgi:hypothetical protein